MRIFINNVNTYSGNCLCETFDEVGKKKTEIYGTIVESDREETENEETIPYYFENVKKIISKIPNDSIVKSILKCDLIIYDLSNTNIEELEYIIHKLKYENVKKKITIILISSIMVWNKTKRKFVQVKRQNNSSLNTYRATNEKLLMKDKKKQETDLKGSDNEVEIKKTKGKKETKEDERKEKKDKKNKKEKKENGKNEQTERNEENIIYIKAPEIFKENNYLQRTCSNNYQTYRSIETLILSLNSVKNINAYVVASGITYGYGENVFFPIFKNAWLSKDNYIIEKGNNFIPVIHIKGLCEYIKDLYIKKSKKKYFIAVDKEYVTQKDIVETVAQYMSDNENYVNVSLENSLLFENTETLCVNLRFQCTTISDSEERKKGEGKKGEGKKYFKRNKKKKESHKDSEENEDTDSENRQSGDDASDNENSDESKEEEEEEKEADNEESGSENENENGSKNENETDNETDNESGNETENEDEDEDENSTEHEKDKKESGSSVKESETDENEKEDTKKKKKITKRKKKKRKNIHN